MGWLESPNKQILNTIPKYYQLSIIIITQYIVKQNNKIVCNSKRTYYTNKINLIFKSSNNSGHQLYREKKSLFLRYETLPVLESIFIFWENFERLQKNFIIFLLRWFSRPNNAYQINMWYAEVESLLFYPPLQVMFKLATRVVQSKI